MVRLVPLLALFMLLLLNPLLADTTTDLCPEITPVSEPAPYDDMSVMKAFAALQAVEGDAVKISDKEKHQWLFLMGVTLLILLLATASLGIAMGIYGKDVFVPHMVCAGLAVTLAIGHAVTAMVWFYPF